MAEGDAATTEPWTIARLLAWAAEDFKRRNFDSPRLDAELLLAAVLAVERVRLLVESTRELTQAELGAYRALIQRRRRAEPIAYILGAREFYGLPLLVDARVLVPRPDTETLVEVALAATEANHLYGEALDLCTGSGCVALAFASRRPTWRVVGTDVSAGAVTVARKNAERLGSGPSVYFVEADLDQGLAAGARFDLVSANPPYIPSGEIPKLMADVRDHEPRLALDGGASGFDVIERVVRVARARLRTGGTLAVEVGHDQAARAARLFSEAGFTQVERRRDYGGIERVVSGRAPGG